MPVFSTNLIVDPIIGHGSPCKMSRDSVVGGLTLADLNTYFKPSTYSNEWLTTTNEHISLHWTISSLTLIHCCLYIFYASIETRDREEGEGEVEVKVESNSPLTFSIFQRHIAVCRKEKEVGNEKKIKTVAGLYCTLNKIKANCGPSAIRENRYVNLRANPSNLATPPRWLWVIVGSS